MADTEISNFGAAGDITSAIDSAKTLISQAKDLTTSAIGKIPSEIKGNISCEGLSTSLSDIIEKCSFAATGVNDNVNSYKNFEKGNDAFSNALASIDPSAYNSISNANQFYWDYLTHTGEAPLKADGNFFASLKTGTYDASNNTFTVSKDGISYTYDITSGTLYSTGSDGKTIKSYVAYFYPQGVTDWSNTNTITFLPGSGEHPSTGRYVLDGNKNVCKVLYGKTSALMISPQEANSYSNKIINSVEFAKAFLNQNSSCVNSLIGFSQGSNEAACIGGNSNAYDIVVTVNGGAWNNVGNLANKEVIIMQSQSDKLTDSAIRLMQTLAKQNAQNVTVVSNNGSVISYGNKYGFNVVQANDSGWTGHSSAWHMVADSGILEYLGDKRKG